MSYKPDESVLLAYVYNELGAEDRAKLEQYLIEHPETKKELEEIKVTRSLLGKWPDQEVVEPSFVFDNPKVLVSSGSAWNSKLLQSIIGLAASIALLMMVGYFTNFQLSKNNEGWNVSMGVPKQEIKPDTSPILTEENVKEWMQESMATNNEAILSRINEVQDDLSGELNQQKRANSMALASLKTNNQIDESLLQGYVDQLKDENKEILLSLVQASEVEQKQYVNQVLADFSTYLEQQRAYDLEIIQANFSNLRDNTEDNQLETNQLLASLITTVNNQNN